MNRRNNSAGRAVIAGFVRQRLLSSSTHSGHSSLAIAVGLVTGVVVVRRIRTMRWGMRVDYAPTSFPGRSTIVSMNNQSPPVAPRQKMFRTTAAFGVIAVALSLVSALDDPERIASRRIRKPRDPARIIGFGDQRRDDHHSGRRSLRRDR